MNQSVNLPNNCLIEQSGLLPDGWIRTTFGDICKIQGGYAFKSKDYREAGILLVRISNLTGGFVELVPNSVFLPEEYSDNFSEYCLRKGDILIAMSGATTGKMAAYNLTLPSLLNQRVGRFIISNPNLINKTYIAKLVESISEQVLQCAYGGAQPNISPSEIEQFSIPLPPLNEQRRIVAKIEALKARSQRVKDALEDARQLEKTLVAYYTTKWTEEELGSHIEERNELAGEYWQKYPLVGLSNEGRITERREPIGQKTAHRCKVVQPGDIVFNPIRFSIGSIARYRGNEPVIVSSEYQVFRTKSTMSAELLCRYLRSQPGQSRLEIETQGSVRYRVYLRNLKRLLMPIAPPDRQIEAEKFFLCLNETFEIVEQVINTMPQLEQSILAQAFRGELVPQDPNDEPASVLLERIRAERAKLQTKTAKKSSTKTSARRTKKTQPQQEESVQLDLGLE